MADNTTPKTNQDYINEMYDKSLSSQTAQMETDYNQNVSDLEGQQKKAQAQADTALTRTYVEAAKKAKNYAETQKASGLTSGTMAQAKLAQDNQAMSDMTAIRTAQQTIEAEIQREKDLLAQEYAAAISKAKADNDLARAQALYEQARADEDALLQKQKEAAALMASAGDYSLYKAIYGLTDEQIAKLQGGGSGGNKYVYVDDSTPDGGPQYTPPKKEEPKASKVPVKKEAGGTSIIDISKANLSNQMSLYK